MATTFVAGKALGIVWTPAGASTIAFNVTSHDLTESVDELDVTHSGSSGIQCMIAGIGRAEATVKANLDIDTGKVYFDSTNKIQAGQKGTLLHLVSSGCSYSLPGIITRVNSSVPINGVVSYEFTVKLDALTGSYTYDATP